MQNKENAKTHVNIEALKSIDNLCDTLKGNHKSETYKVTIEVNSYSSALYSAKQLINAAKYLSIDAQDQDHKEALPMIYNLCDIAMQMLPIDEMDLLDNLLLNPYNQKSKLFKPVDEILK